MTENKKQTPQLLEDAVMPCALSVLEIEERNNLLELQKSKTRWFSQEEFYRLKKLSIKMFLANGNPHKA